MSIAATPALAREEKNIVRHWRNPIIYAVLALTSLLLVGLKAPSNTVNFRLSDGLKSYTVPDLAIDPTVYGWIASITMAAIAAFAFVQMNKGHEIHRALQIAFWFFFITGMLVWIIGSARSSDLSLVTLLTGALTLSIPMIFGSLGGLLCERSGIINIAIEAQLLLGAFTAVLAASITGNPWVGLVAAMVGGVLVSLILAVFSIKYLVDQTIVGVVVNVLVSGLTGFLYSRVLQADQANLNSAPKLPTFEIPVLSQIPVVGPVLFNQSVLVYLMYLTVGLIWFALNKTKWGLRTRAVGEHPKAADTLGVNVNRLRFTNVLLAGVVAGMGGAFFTLVSVSSFNANMTAGQGYIALAALIFGRWKPFGALFASLLFGFTLQLNFVLSLLGTSVPTELLAMLPYLVTIFAVAGLVGASRGPAAAGKPYIKG
ncbi:MULTISPECIES: ABC transporter permease [unclassified Rothia (in: high G+C Gram-positive bacteria)]|uniref:ABC transporter permease n=1 Tax=unclassified Rothia (in: high G+C Gram-positive bacteria) TaxID=2689056 RepID=UPI001959A7C6|nr:MULTISPECIES: ABC transporter permease [unclassified Rothia (in: high G+C Gram-positive bacteria)]MBM7051461.1 ABC transporter permease [Rothia sp. ZJ1223]QRZ61250.1 ABC transporter permease [Rothia sp. ZJ932]